MTKTIYVHEFSIMPHGLTRQDSEFSAQAFREDILIPALKEGSVTVDFDDIEGVPSNWLREVFSSLKSHYSKMYIRDNLVIKSDKDDSLIIEIDQYIND